MTLFEWVKDNVPILDVIGEYIRLQRAGTYWKGSCIFHSETDASFTVSPDRQIFYCFGCQAGGDVVAFVARAENLSQIEAVDFLIERRGLTVPPELLADRSGQKESASEKKLYHAACEFFAQWAARELEHSDAARSYLDSRSISEETLKKFNIGYIPGGATAMGRLVRAAHQSGVLVKTLIETGVLGQSSHTSYHSPFEERIIFPIRDSIGRMVGFGGRVFQKGDERPKYYNSRESNYFSKRNLLFGFDVAKAPIKEKGIVYLVEGYLDVLALSQASIPNVVATLGTACTSEHLTLLSRFAHYLNVMYDGDAAGKKATLRLAELSWEANLDIRVVVFPTKDDPASYLAQGGDPQELVSNIVPIFDFFVAGAAENFSTLSLSQKVEIGKRLAQAITRLQDPFKRLLLSQQAAQALGVSVEIMRDLVERSRKPIRPVANEIATEEAKSASSNAPANGGGQSTDGVRKLEQQIIAGILNDYEGIGALDLIDEDVLSYFSDDVRELVELLRERKFSAQSKDGFEAIIHELSDDKRERLIASSLQREVPPTRREFETLLANFCRQHWRLVMTQLKADIQKARQSSDYAKMKELLRSFSTLRHNMKAKGLV
jgi:DNA primase